MNKRVAKDEVAVNEPTFYQGEESFKSAGGRKGRPAPEARSGEAEGGIPFKIETLDSIAPVRRTNWLIKGLMPARGLHVIYGPPGAGKSFVSIHAALHIAAGLPWAGRKVNRCGVIYVASEGADGIRTRIAAARRRLKVPVDAPFGLVTEAPIMTHQPRDTHRLIESIREQSKRLSCAPGVIFLDTLSRSIPGLDENKSGDMMVFVDRAKELAKALDVLVVPIHHTGKDDEKGMRGSSALHGATDAVWVVKGEGEGRVIQVQKMRDGPDRLPLAFALETVKLEEDDDGDPLETCVMQFTEHSPAHVRLSGNLQAVLDVLRVLSLSEGRSAAGVPTATRVVEEKRLREVLAGSDLLHNVKASSLSTMFPRYLDDLKQAGRISREGGIVWLAGK